MTKSHALVALVAIIAIGSCLSTDELTVTNESQPYDLYNILQVSLDEDILSLEFSYPGGCADHDFSLVWDGSFLPMEGSQVVVRLSHDSNGESCSDLVTEDLDFDLSAIKEAYAAAHGTGGTVVVHYLDYDNEEQKLNYTFEKPKEPAPLVCTMEAKECPDGSFVGRNPENDCEFDDCPEVSTYGRACEATSQCGIGFECVKLPDEEATCDEPDPCDRYSCPEDTSCSMVRTQLTTVSCRTEEEQRPAKPPVINTPNITASNVTTVEPPESQPTTAPEVTVVTNPVPIDAKPVEEVAIAPEQKSNASAIPAPIMPAVAQPGDSIELSVVGDTPVYVVTKYRKARLFLILPVEIRIVTTVDATTGEVISEKRPWWSFLVRISE